MSLRWLGLRGLGHARAGWSERRRGGTEQGGEELSLAAERERELVCGGQGAEPSPGEPGRDPTERVGVDLELGGEIGPALSRHLAADGMEQQEPVEHVLEAKGGLVS